MRLAYGPLFGLRDLAQKPLDYIAAFSRRVDVALPGTEPVLEKALSRPIVSAVRYLGRRTQALQMGDVRTYCLYIFVALAVLLVVIFR